MKYLKYFESEKIIIPEGKNYWSIRNDEFYFSKQLDKIDCTEKEKKNLISELDWYDEDVLFLGIEKQRTPRAEYYINYRLDHSGKYFTDRNYHYNGTISLTKEEIEEVKAEKSASKFNL